MTRVVKRSPDPTRQRRLAGHYLRGSDSDVARMQRTVSLAARSLGFPIGQINILDDRELSVVGDYGSGVTAVPRNESMCQFLIDDGVAVLAVDDLREHERYRFLPCVHQGVAVSYLGVALVSREASMIGSLCVADNRARHITAGDIQRLAEFGEIVEDQLDLIRRNAETDASREVSAMIAAALDNDEIVPWYQPVVELSTDARVAFEALARWRRPDGSFVNPADFVGAAEDSDLVVDLDRAVARAAIEDLARWRRTEPSLQVSVNLSTRHLELPDGASYLVEAAEAARLDPSALVIEITETRMLSDVARATATVRELQDAGMRVLLDDFANGWSSLDWLIGLGVNGIKLDRTVTTALGTRAGDAVCRAVVGMAADLDISTTIEGIEGAAHLLAAREHGFVYAQGYYWSAPVPAVVVDATI
ncbi:EAL domain-containing protein [uncultured Jatrophihabitans sp.]|uniref:EAL domain-containing protein n=1 Tax=uncultured Jatrophihabitans sp. TaxID=1610747 RepID=UPI0035CC2928